MLTAAILQLSWRHPVYRLFWKIFFLFWVVNAVVFALGISLAHLFNDRLEQQRHKNFPVAQIAENAVYAHEVGKMNRFLSRLQRRMRIEAWLVDDNGGLLGPQRTASRMPPMASFPAYSLPTRDNGNRHVHRVKVESETGDQYYFVAAYPDTDTAPDVPEPVALLALSILTIAATSILIAGFITQPLRRLQRAVRTFAGGDLTTRVTDLVAGRKDAVGELGREFNVMAARLDAMMESQRQLMRDISHELRTPLARMQVAATLAEDCGSQAASMPLARIHTEIQLLDALIGQVMALARLESGTDKLVTEVFELDELLQQLVADAEFEFAEDGKTVCIDQVVGLEIQADRNKLHSAIENVVRNAMRHTPAGTQVTITAWEDDKDIAISVRDCGPGVPKEHQQSMFNAFFRCEDSRDARSGGHGVGLAITRGIVLAHGGGLAASNHPQGGLVVGLRLPQAKASCEKVPVTPLRSTVTVVGAGTAG